jgi:hypothetical protein
MAGCDSIVGVKNILMTFHDCSNGQKYGPYSHKLATDELPTWKTCVWTNEAMTQGYTRRTASNAGVEINVIRDLRIPLSYYQGCAGIDLQVEMENGLVYTGKSGGVLGDDKSDGHEVAMELTFRQLDELLPVGQVAA